MTPVPAGVAQVDGCTCGGLEWHQVPDPRGGPGCALWSLPGDRALAAVDDARERLRAYVAGLSARLPA